MLHGRSGAQELVRPRCTAVFLAAGDWLLIRCLCLDLSHLVVVGDEIRIFEENDRVLVVRLDAEFAESVRALVTGKHDFLHTVILHLTVRLIRCALLIRGLSIH